MMDQTRFDELTRSLCAGRRTRRQFAVIVRGAFAVLGLGSVLGPPAATGARPKKGKKKKKKKPTSCALGAVRCDAACVDTQTDADHCGGCGAACAPGVNCLGGQCQTTGCGASQIDCGGGLCIPDVEHACCDQGDCGGSGSFNDLVCNASTHRCECIQDGYGICQRFFPAGTGLCGRCCPGSVYGLGDQCVRPEDDYICVNQTLAGCSCPPAKPLSCNSPGFGVRCRADGNDPRACGNSCETCDDSECCINGNCFNRLGCGPGFGGGGCTDYPCGSCTFFCPPETPLCCALGPAAAPTCVAGTLCPPPGP